MSLSARKCPDCERDIRVPFQETITGRWVCPDCANALMFVSTVSIITGEPSEGFSLWAALMSRIRRSKGTVDPGTLESGRVDADTINSIGTAVVEVDAAKTNS